MSFKPKRHRHRDPSKHHLSTIPLSKLLPSIITTISLCLGITSIRYALDAKWTIAFALIFISGLLDGLDGRLARLLNATSGFGAQLDSLADMVSFGVAPAIIMYLWCLNEIPIKGVGWSVVLLFVGCAALRLARFNSALTAPEEKKMMAQFFVGIPMPAGGLTAMLPMLLSFEMLDRSFFPPEFIALYIMLIGFLMISKIPTFSLKSVQIKKEHISMVMAFITLISAGIILEPWLILPLINIAYIISIPYGLRKYRSLNS